jgi:hypothetical protein
MLRRPLPVTELLVDRLLETLIASASTATAAAAAARPKPTTVP